MTQEDLAERCGLFRTYMSRIETGQANPTLTMIHALADSLGLPVVRLFQKPAAPAKKSPTAAAAPLASSRTSGTSRPSRGRVR